MRIATDPINVNVTKAEAMCRAMGFRIVYNGVFADIADLTTRFACAIAYSAKEMSDRTLFQSWWTWTGGKSMKAFWSQAKNPRPYYGRSWTRT